MPSADIGVDLPRRPTVRIPQHLIPALLISGLLLAGLLGCQQVSHPGAVAESAPALAEVKPANRRTEPVVEPWTFGKSAGECIDTGTHRIHSTLRDPVIRDRIQIFLPTALDHYRSAIIPLPEPDGPIEVFLFGSRSDWMAYTRERLPQEAAMYEQIGRGGYTIEGDAVLYDIGRWDTFTIAAHEGWHAYSQRVFRHSLPVWLEEGIACYMEGVRGGVNGGPPTFIPWRNFERYGELRDVVYQNRLVPLDEFVQGTPQDYLKDGRRTLLGYYAQAWALVHFLSEGEGGHSQRAPHGDRPAGGRGRDARVLRGGPQADLGGIRGLRARAREARERREDLARRIAVRAAAADRARAERRAVSAAAAATLRACSRSSPASIARASFSHPPARTARAR